MSDLPAFDIEALRAEFPLLQLEQNGRPIAYFDNAATMQVPEHVMSAVENFMRTSNANVHRGHHRLSEGATVLYEQARETVAGALGCSAGEVIFTSGATDGLNKLAFMLLPLLAPGDAILITGMEHHSNLLPWRRVAQIAGATVRVAPVAPDGSFDTAAMANMVDPRTKVVAAAQLSNVSGVQPDLCLLAEAAHAQGAVLAVDGAQGFAHAAEDPAQLGCDAYVFSGHKIGAPTGIGVLRLSSELAQNLEPATFGGGAVASVTADGFALRPGPERFEPGTPNTQGAIGLAAAIRFWAEAPQATRAQLVARESDLVARLEQGAADIPGVHVIAPSEPHRGALSLWFESGTSYDACKLLDARGVAVRSGHHCAQPYCDALGLGSKGALRISVAPYNTFAEVDRCLDALRAASAILGG